MRILLSFEIAFTVIHPKIELKTKDSRAVVKDKVSMKNLIEQSANLGAFISGLYTEDYELIGRSIKDVIIEPLRSVLIPKFEEIPYPTIMEPNLVIEYYSR